MNVTSTEIPDVLHVQPRVFGDTRGFFLELYNAARYAAVGIPAQFVQDNVSLSERGTLRGLHLQHPHGQGKLVGVLAGKVLDVAVDLRVGSPTFGRHAARVLDGEQKNQLWIPPGLAHGFYVIEGPALFVYKCTDFYHPEHEITLRWDDPDLAIEWGIRGRTPTLSAKDREGKRLRDLGERSLPRWRSA